MIGPQIGSLPDLLASERRCKTCATIDFDGFFAEAVSKLGRRAATDVSISEHDSSAVPRPTSWTDYGGIVNVMTLRIDHIDPEHGCALCIFLSGLRYRPPDQDCDTPVTLLCLVLRQSPSDWQKQFHMRVVQLAQLPSPAYNPRNPTLARVKIRFRDCPEEKKFVLVLRKWAPPTSTVNFNTIKKVISNSPCHESHGSVDDGRAGSFVANLPGWRVIDCRTKSILGLQECIAAAGTFDQVHYATLSYVWGNSPSGQPVDAKKLPVHLPRVVEDAMTVVLSLGFRYLWVDRYCIPQNDKRERLHQIRNMNLIYHRSCLTIVAAAGSGPGYGLPGVGKTTRSVPRTFRLGSHLVRQWFSADWIAKQITDSKWNSRAWTYQEAALSRKMLYFANSFVIFDRKAGPCQFEGPAGSEVPHGDDIWRGGDSSHWFAPTYARRELSSESDIFLAFQGLQSHLNNRMPDHRLFYGLIIDYRDCELSHALWWYWSTGHKHNERPRRRPPAPSWTWLGWRAPKSVESLDMHTTTTGSELAAYQFDYHGVADLSLVYEDGFIFPWRSMTRERIIKLQNERQDGSVKFLVANAWTFGVESLLSQLHQKGRTENPFVEWGDPYDSHAVVGEHRLFQELGAAARLYGLPLGSEPGPDSALYVVLGLARTSDEVVENPKAPRSCSCLLLMAVISNDGGESWQRASVTRMDCGRDIWDRDWRSFGWEKRELKIY